MTSKYMIDYIFSFIRLILLMGYIAHIILRGHLTYRLRWFLKDEE